MERRQRVEASAPVEPGRFHAAEVACTGSDESIDGAAVGLEGHVEHDAEQAQGTGHLGDISQGANEGVEGGLLHGAMLAGQRLHQHYCLNDPASQLGSADAVG